ncbi:MAG TPA: S9 family peptidase [Terriglobales bacterium]|jgi:dipeptidyl aminopeptidase/acylaminoacyl peptidase|nr:S9 family peptidase [Terriglobales bacterium]
MKVFLHLAAILILTAFAFSQSDEIAPNENLVAEAIPKIPASLAETVDRYSNFRGASLDSWDPVKREMLISTRFADTNQIHLVKMPGGARTQITFYADRVASAQFPPTRDDSFIFSKDVGGGEFFQLYRYEVASGDVTLLTDGKSRNIDPIWSYAGDKLAYGSTRRTGNDVDLYVINPADPKSDHLLAQLQGGGWSPLDWSPDGQKILANEGISANESYVWLVDATSGEKTLLTPKGGDVKIAYNGGRFSKDGKGIYVTTDKDSEFLRLTYIDLATKQHTYLTSNIHWDVDEFDLSNDGRTIAFVTNEDGLGILHLLDTKTRKEKPVPSLPKGLVSGISWHKNNRDLGFSISSAHTSSDVYSLDVQSGKVDRWTFSETGGLSTATFSEPDLIHWKSWDGRSISGFLYRPPAKYSGKRPVIINIHGGPEGQFRPGFAGRWNYYLNELGVAMIAPNVRGSTGYGKTFLALDNGFLREGSYQDINTLLDWIQTQPDLDSSRVMITGGSYGGFMTLAVATNYNDRICCSVDVVGPSNLVTFLEHTSGYRQDLRRVEYGDERDLKMRAFLERIAPANNAKNITKPLFVIAGKNDPRVPVSESQQMVNIVRQNGTPVWWLMAKDEGHGFAKKKNQDYQFDATVMFVKEYLLK